MASLDPPDFYSPPRTHFAEQSASPVASEHEIPTGKPDRILRGRLLVGLVSLLILLLVIGGCSIWLIARLEVDIHSILKDNYESIRACHNVRLAVLRMNAGLLRPNVAEVASLGSEALEAHYAPTVEATVTTVRLLARTPADVAQARTLTDQVDSYLDDLRAILALPRDAQERYNRMRMDLIQKNLALTATTQEILQNNEDAMLRAYEHAQRVARDTVWFLTAAMAIAVLVFIWTYHRMGRSLILPIEELTQSLDAVRAGRFEQNLPVKSNDELSRLACAFNAMAEELRTYRRDTDETILRLNRSLRETIAAFPYPVVLLNASFAIWVTNKAADAFLEGIGTPRQLPDSIQRQLSNVRRTQQNYLPDDPRDSMLFRINEQEVHYLPRILRIFSPEGDFSGAAVILIDVSRFRWLDEMKTNLISTISHEIKTPLTGIRMILHLLLERSSGSLTPMQTQMVRAACDDGERLLATLNSLLDLSRMEAGSAQLDRHPVSPRELLEQVRSAFQTQADDRPIALEIQADDDLPPILGDSGRLMHAIGNFVSNALKHAPEHSTVRLAAELVGTSFVRLSVTDSGAGVPDKYHAQIFDKFFRSPGSRVEGVGLGLSIAREIVQAHDGRIGVQSTPHVATCFYCELPVAR